MPNVATWIVPANYHLDLAAKDTRVRSTGLPLPSKGRGEGEGSDLLKQMRRVALEPLTLVLSPSRRGEATEHTSAIKSGWNLTR